ncbi:MAG TPA: HEAT repeat domain-containing protein [Streptosporangiaceae bacterium]
MRQTGEIQHLRSALTDAGVAGAGDFGRFVNDTSRFGPSAFDARAAMPVLVRMLPSLADPHAVEAVAGHLAAAWSGPAVPALITAFRRWAAQYPLGTGWQLGNAIAAAAGNSHAAEMLALAVDARFGAARQMIVYSLWRFRRQPGICAALPSLCHDPDVALHAMSALRRAVGNEQALPTLLHIAGSHADPRVRKHAAQAARRAQKALQAHA